MVPKSYLILLFFSATVQPSAAQYNNFYIGLGTSVSSYGGGYFGSAYCMRVLSGNYNYDDSYNYYNNNYYNDYTTIWSPLQFDVNMGYYLNDNVAIEMESSFIYHLNGRVDPNFITGSTGKDDYIDGNSTSQLYAMPLSAMVKLFPSGASNDPYYFKIGPSFQYTSESYDRVRQYYSYSYYDSYTHYAYLGTVAKTEWLPGFKAAMGFQYNFSEAVAGYSEIEYSYYKINPNYLTKLALDQSKYAQLFSFKTTVFFGF